MAIEHPCDTNIPATASSPAISDRTQVIYGEENALRIELQVFKRARSRIDAFFDKNGPTIALGDQFLKTSTDLVGRGIKLRFITEITKENIATCKELADHAEIRHLEGGRGNFELSESEYVSAGASQEGKKIRQLLYSCDEVLVEQQRYLFDVLWSKSTTSSARFAELESSESTLQETKIIRGSNEIMRVALAFLQRSTTSYLLAASDKRPQKDPKASIDFIVGLMKQNHKFKFKLVTDIQKENIEYNKKLIENGVDVKHLERNRIAFAVSKDEYMAAELAAIEEQVASGAELPSEMIWSNRTDIASQANQVFEMMWNTATPAESRIKQLEQGIEPEETRLFDDIKEVYRIGAKMTEECKNEVLMILASDRTVLRNSTQYEQLAQKQRQTGLKIRILSPSLNPDALHILPQAEWKRVEPMKVSISIYDRGKMFITQYTDSDAKTTQKAVYSNIYTTNEQTITGMVSVFEALWRESELREAEESIRRELTHSLAKEERSRRQAQLLQDILTHDIRNFNQVSMLSAELLKERLSSIGDKEGQDLADNLLDSIEGATSLVERGKKLGKILSEENPELYPVNIAEALQKSLTLVRQATPDKILREDTLLSKSSRLGAEKPYAIADDLLDEVFTNVFSNAAKYTEGPVVPIKIRISESDGYWKISISDEGVGIPEAMRDKIFERYVAGARGSGLGMSIIHALVVNRYGGKVVVADQYSLKDKGTTIELWLRSAAMPNVDHAVR
ncbi:MAG: ATP-binding protein [Nitrososphaerales archaeon]